MYERYTNNLKCYISVHGSSAEGESIVIVIKDDIGKIVFVVDSFQNGDINIPNDFLINDGINKIDYLVWTHPHDDHTKGLEKLLEQKVENILIPLRLDDCVYNLGDYYKNVYNAIRKISSIGCDNRKKSWTVVEEISSSSVIDVANYVINLTNRCEVKLVAFSPESQRLANISNSANPNCNDYSIAFNLIIGDFVVSLTSDIENNTIQYSIRREKVFDYYPNIIKIPHHGSESSDDILSLFTFCKENEDSEQITDSLFGISTSMSKNGLPNQSTLKKYTDKLGHVLKIDDSITNSELARLDFEIDVKASTVEIIGNQNFIEV